MKPNTPHSAYHVARPSVRLTCMYMIKELSFDGVEEPSPCRCHKTRAVKKKCAAGTPRVNIREGKISGPGRATCGVRTAAGPRRTYEISTCMRAFKLGNTEHRTQNEWGICFSA
ncbi:hypothetical protein EVAR_82963_1 [Eumeta japonica]|uniref:Uncharacterized protein n=1 Tax=Eumeta variegata TaxID=151549 RepID=A0A4C1VQQ5_EUMVA|nr:hypothetical protein EVAR_82963_1 [Eumeta japonica]